MNEENVIQKKLHALATSAFRAKFRLHDAKVKMVQEKGLPTIRQHAEDILTKRLKPALPANDGKQTPFKGHPVFIAQHATATCCRSCLARWHHIQKGKELTETDLSYIVTLIEVWIQRQLSRNQ